ncbi:MAG TPA: glycosyltransferase family 39 protein, partial [bacterium]
MLLLIVLLAAFLRLFLLGHKSFGADEGIAWWMALGEIEHDAPAVYQWAFGWAMHLFGWTEFAGRFPSALFGLLYIPVIYAIGRSCFDSRFGLYAASFAAFSAYLVPLSQELRIYSLLGLEILLSLWIFLQILKKPGAHAGWWMALLVVGLAGQYTHCFFIFVLGYLGLALLGVKRPGKWRDALKYLVIMVAVILLSLPELLKTFSVAADRPQIYAADIYHFKMNAWRLLRSYFCFLFGDYFTNRPGSILPFLKSHPEQIGMALLMTGTWIVAAFLALRQIRRIVRGDNYQAL